MPLHRRVPKRGFTNIFAPVTKEIGLTAISNNYKDGETVSRQSLRERKLIGSKIERVVVLASGKLTCIVTVNVDRVTKGAREAILAKGGTIVEPVPTQAKS